MKKKFDYVFPNKKQLSLIIFSVQKLMSDWVIITCCKIKINKMEVTEVFLVKRPGVDNPPSNSNFGIRKTVLRASDHSMENYVIVESLYLSVDPALRQIL